MYTKTSLQSIAALLCILLLGLGANSAYCLEDNSESLLVERVEQKLNSERGQALVDHILNHREQRKEHFRVMFQNLDIQQRKKWDIRERVFNEQQGSEQVLETEMGLSVDIPADAHVVMTNIETGEVIEPLHEGFKLVFKATIDEPQSRGYVMSCLSYVEGQQRNPNFRLMVTAEDMKRFSVVYTPRQMLKRHIRDLTKAAFQASKQELVAAFKENVDLIKRTLSKPLRKPAIALLRVKLKRDIQRAHGEAKRSVRRSVDKRALLAEFALSPKLRETIRFDVVQNVTRCQMGPVH